jgi:hypothetical protein
MLWKLLCFILSIFLGLVPWQPSPLVPSFQLVHFSQSEPSSLLALSIISKMIRYRRSLRHRGGEVLFLVGIGACVY